MGRSEELGTGVNNVFKYSKKYSGSDNIIFKEEDTFITIVPLLPEKQRKAIKPYDNDTVNEGVNEGVNSLYNLIRSTPLQRTPYFTEKLNTPVKTIERWIKILKEDNKIKFVGSNKTGGYKIQ